MALNRLTGAEMVQLSDDLVREGSPQRTAIEAIPQAAAMQPQIAAAHDGVLATQPPSDHESAAVTEALQEADTVHDLLAGVIDRRLELELAIASDGDVDALARTRAVVLPEGPLVGQRSFLEQAGAAQLRARRLDDASRQVLRRLGVYDGRTLLDLVDELQASAATINELLERRKALSDRSPRGADAHAARLQWIRTIHALASVLEMLGADEEPILGRIREAERSAEQRTRARARNGAGPATPDAPTDGPGPDGPVEDAPVVDEPPVVDPVLTDPDPGRPGRDEPEPEPAA